MDHLEEFIDIVNAQLPSGWILRHVDDTEWNLVDASGKQIAHYMAVQPPKPEEIIAVAWAIYTNGNFPDEDISSIGNISWRK